MARNRYGWNKRSKEIARKQKSEEKMKRRQGKISTAAAEEDTPEVMGEVLEEIMENPGEEAAAEDMVQPE